MKREVREPTTKERKVYTAFSDQQRAAIGKYAVECGNTAAVRKYRLEIPNIGESTVRVFKKRYLKPLRASPGAGLLQESVGALLLLETSMGMYRNSSQP